MSYFSRLSLSLFLSLSCLLIITPESKAETGTAKFVRANTSGSGNNLTFSLVDLQGEADYTTPQFQVKYGTGFKDSRSLLSYATRYEGLVPPELVQRNGNRFTIEIGQLPIHKRYLRSGLPVEIELKIIPAANEIREQEISWRGRLRS